MAAETIPVPAPAMPAVAGPGRAAGGSSIRAGAGLPPPRRGQIKEKIVKDIVAAVTAFSASLVKNNRADGDQGLPASDDADAK